jgi:prefoldin subunit 5
MSGTEYRPQTAAERIEALDRLGDRIQAEIARLEERAHLLDAAKATLLRMAEREAEAEARARP